MVTQMAGHGLDGWSSSPGRPLVIVGQIAGHGQHPWPSLPDGPVVMAWMGGHPRQADRRS
jgi:hypothetical protein